ncbi:LIM domain only protein 7-like [Salmo trutta]|uniref:LIM domain only protein 7-like n=1 Tax=Salmo trutta TaxID=8032 RepID=UPI001131F985|nr:LIM domain only protein 7-like [Salmo trutta]
MGGGSNQENILEQQLPICTGKLSFVVLIDRIKPGIIKRVNRLSTPIAGLCEKGTTKTRQTFPNGGKEPESEATVS